MRTYLSDMEFVDGTFAFASHAHGRVVSNPCEQELYVTGQLDGTNDYLANKIRSDANIQSGNTVFEAQNEISLESNFEVAQGAVFTADVTPCAGTAAWQYEYFLRDHLGNNRIVFADKNGNNSIETDEVLQENHYYAFGMAMEGDWTVAPAFEQGYRYNGIERNQELGLDLAFFRSYDPAIGRWMQVDPKAEAFTWASPYNGMLNNPISNIDPLGDTTRVYNMGGELVRTINDSHANQDHFLTSGAMGILNGAALDGAGSDLIGSAFRALSSFFIGANTRAGLEEIMAQSEAEGLERGFKLSVANGSKELLATDITGTRSRTKSTFDFPNPPPEMFRIKTEKMMGHSHNTAGVIAEGVDPNNISSVHWPTLGGKGLVDYESLLTGDRSRAYLQMIISRNGYSIYTSARNTPTGSSHPYPTQILSKGGPIVSFRGITVIK
jgi:RHS repeat-associated protein